MICQRLAAQDLGPLGPQGGEEARGVGDPGKCEHPLTFPVHSHAQRLKPAPQARKFAGAPDGIEPGLGGGVPDDEHQVGAGQAGGDGLAQRSGGDAAAIAEAAGGEGE